jgi:hypothetical protein
MLWFCWSDIAGAFILRDIGINGLVVDPIVAIDVTRVWFPADAICVFCDCGLDGVMGQPTQDHILLWSWRGQMWQQFLWQRPSWINWPLDQGKATVLSHRSEMSFAMPYTNAWHLMLLAVAADCCEDWWGLGRHIGIMGAFTALEWLGAEWLSCGIQKGREVVRGPGIIRYSPAG